MTEDSPSPAGDATPPPQAPVEEPAQAPPAHPHETRLTYAVLGLFVAGILFGLWGVWKTVAGPESVSQAQLDAGQARIGALEQQVATLARSDQISRDANRDLQGTLAERDEEISALRADVAFYERFVGSTAQRRGLSVHELKFEPQTDLAWHYTATLTQNLNRGAVSSGRLTLSIEGTQAGKLQRLDWAALRQEPEAAGVEYSFKYFQQVEGEVVLPAGFQPLRVSVRLVPQGGAPVEQTLPWGEATGSGRPAAD